MTKEITIKMSVPAVIQDEISDEYLSFWKDFWVPENDKYFPDKQMKLENGVFPWDKLAHKIGKAEKICALVCNNELEGLMHISLNKVPNLNNLYPKNGVVYIEQIEVAPWNRFHPAIKRKYSLVGTELIKYASEISVSDGFAGRVGLHSLEKACKFYRESGFDEYEPDPTLSYFELPSKVLNFKKPK